jgi:hypothetical protein
LNHLNSTGIQLLSTCELNPPHSGFSNNLTNLMLNPFTGDMWAEPWRDKARSHRIVGFPDWWQKEVIFSLGTITVSRRELTVWASNKDGGAHVDHDPGVDYERVRQGMNFTFTVGRPDGTSEICQARELHLAALRQFGCELLNSPELLKLAGR